MSELRSSTSAESESAPPILSLEDRLLVALSARGSQRIGRFIVDADPNVLHTADEVYDWLFDLSDEELVLALEAAVGSAEGDVQ